MTCYVGGSVVAGVISLFGGLALIRSLTMQHRIDEGSLELRYGFLSLRDPLPDGVASEEEACGCRRHSAGPVVSTFRPALASSGQTMTCRPGCLACVLLLTQHTDFGRTCGTTARP
jgi:hypothetical protein